MRDVRVYGVACKPVEAQAMPTKTVPLRFSTVSENTSRCRRNLCRFLGYFRNRVHSWTFGHSHQGKLQFLSPNVHRVLVPFDISDLFVDQLR